MAHAGADGRESVDDYLPLPEHLKQHKASRFDHWIADHRVDQSAACVASEGFATMNLDLFVETPVFLSHASL